MSYTEVTVIVHQAANDSIIIPAILQQQVDPLG